jgi:hypothetical protein
LFKTGASERAAAALLVASEAPRPRERPLAALPVSLDGAAGTGGDPSHWLLGVSAKGRDASASSLAARRGAATAARGGRPAAAAAGGEAGSASAASRGKQARQWCAG